MQIRRFLADVAPPEDTWQDLAVPAVPHRRFGSLEFQKAGVGWNRRGVELAKAGRYEEALDAYLRAREENPSSAVIRSNLSRAYRRAGRLEDALLELAEACRLAPTNPEYARRAAALHAESADIDAAEAEYLRAAALAPDEIDIWLELYNTVATNQRLVSAARIASCLTERYPDHPVCSEMQSRCLVSVAADLAESGFPAAAREALSAADSGTHHWPYARAYRWAGYALVRLSQRRLWRAAVLLTISLAIAAMAFLRVGTGRAVRWIMRERSHESDR